MGAIVLEASDKDALKETANVCAGQAVCTLSNILQEKVLLSLSDVDVTSDTSWAAGLDPAIGISKSMSGEMEGNLVITLKEADARWLATTLKTKEEDAPDDDDERIEHMGGLIAEAYLEAFAAFIGLELTHGKTDMVTSPVEDIIKRFLPPGGMIVKLRTSFIVGDEGVEGSMFFLLDQESASTLIRTIKEKFS